MPENSDTLSPNVFLKQCPSRSVLHHLTGKWGALTVTALLGGSMRFGQLRRTVDGVSDKMLSQTLGELERDGIVSRCVLSAIPPHVEYSLTPLGREISLQLRGLIDVVESKMMEVSQARQDYDQTHGIP